MSTRSGGILPPDTAIRYVIIKKPKGSMEDHSIFLITKSIESFCRFEEVRNNRDGSLSVALKEKYARRLVENMKELADKTPVEVLWDDRRNTSRGVVVCKQLGRDSESDIKTELNSQGVTDARHIFRRDGENKINTGVVILTFGSPTPPEKIKIGYRICHVERYYPRPMQCYRCYEFKHISKFCKNAERCKNCATKAHDKNEECPNETKCVNCNGNHLSTSKTCNSYRQQQQIIRIQVDENISYHAARNKLLKSTGVNSYANVTSDAQKMIEEARKKWEKDMDEKMKFINAKIEELNKRESELRNYYNFLKEKEINLKTEMKQLKDDYKASEIHCNVLTNELQKKDEIIKKLTNQLEQQDQKIANIKEKHAKKIKTDKPQESSPEREIQGTPKRKHNKKKQTKQK